MLKMQQKISGLFRTVSGAEQFCVIISFISTVKKQRFSIIDALERILNAGRFSLNLFLSI